MGFSMKRQYKLELKKEEILSCVKKKKKKTGKGVNRHKTTSTKRMSGTKQQNVSTAAKGGKVTERR